MKIGNSKLNIVCKTIIDNFQVLVEKNKLKFYEFLLYLLI